mmetsp:Transcript_55487/g.87996  ORF Transcript_55487/g.87996 Transcript_55487/m.87996 type:complete len:89 (-) Transcript_55487:66-332(-)
MDTCGCPLAARTCFQMIFPKLVILNNGSTMLSQRWATCRIWDAIMALDRIGNAQHGINSAIDSGIGNAPHGMNSVTDSGMLRPNRVCT